MNVFALLKHLQQSRVLRQMGQNPRFHLTIVCTEQVMSRRRDEGFTNTETVVPFTGIFCRFGSVEERRPVAATVWLREVWSRPVSGFTSCGKAST